MKAMCYFCALNHPKGLNLIELTRLMRTMLSDCILIKKRLTRQRSGFYKYY
jgi:hypothetical protein